VRVGYKSSEGRSREHDATGTTKSTRMVGATVAVAATASLLPRASSTRELYLNAVPRRESHGVAKQRVCHDRRRR